MKDGFMFLCHLDQPTYNAPTTNLSESVHSFWKTINATNLTLVDAAYHDICESICIERQLKYYRMGTFSSGGGSSAYKCKYANYQEQMRQAELYAEELLTV